MDAAPIGRRNFRAASVFDSSRICFLRLQFNPQSRCVGDRFQFALAVHQASSLAVRRMAAAYSLRHPDSCHELFPDTFSMAVSDSVR